MFITSLEAKIHSWPKMSQKSKGRRSLKIEMLFRRKLIQLFLKKNSRLFKNLNGIKSFLTNKNIRKLILILARKRDVQLGRASTKEVTQETVHLKMLTFNSSVSSLVLRSNMSQFPGFYSKIKPLQTVSRTSTLSANSWNSAMYSTSSKLVSLVAHHQKR